MNLIDYTDKAIMKMLLDQVLHLNTWLRIGEKFTESTANVANGKIVTLCEGPDPPNLIKVLTNPIHITLPLITSQVVSVKSVKLKLADIATFRTSGLKALDFKLTERVYLHPYTVHIPCREWLEDYQLGDLVCVSITDPNTFQQVIIETPLTQQMIDDNSDVVFRFALSNV